MNTTADRIHHYFLLTLGYLAALGLLASLPAVLLIGVTGTTALGQAAMIVIAAIASIVGAVALSRLHRVG